MTIATYVVDFAIALGVASLVEIAKRMLLGLRGRRTLRISSQLRPGSIARKYGMTQATVRVSIHNHGNDSIVVEDLFLMFSDKYGFPLPQEAPDDLQHKALPVRVSPQSSETWYFPAEVVSQQLYLLYTASTPVDEWTRVDLFVKCVISGGRVFRGECFEFPTDPGSHFRNPQELRRLFFLQRAYKRLAGRWGYVAMLFAVVYILVRLVRDLVATSPP